MRGILRQYRPLCSESFGLRNLQQARHLKPFEEGSIRREPDFVHPNPLITALGGAKRVVPFLRVGDEVVYFTVQIDQQIFLPAILKVVDEVPTHEEAAQWYRERELQLPTNCLVDENPAKGLMESHGKHFIKGMPTPAKLYGLQEADLRTMEENLVEEWDGALRGRSQETGRCLITEQVYVYLEDPPAVDQQALFEILHLRNRFMIQSFKKISESQLREIKEVAGI